jgi:hypothetical protein
VIAFLGFAFVRACAVLTFVSPLSTGILGLPKKITTDILVQFRDETQEKRYRECVWEAEDAFAVVSQSCGIDVF